MNPFVRQGQCSSEVSAWRRLGLLVAAVVGVLCCAPPASADPAAADPEPSPWPDIRYYDAVDAGAYAQPGGVWFIGPTGQNCGIWGLGNFGCVGDLPGAPQGTTHIGWINGDRSVHYDWSMAVRFPNSQATLTLPPRSSITHEGTTCAATPDGRTYCERGPMRFAIEPTRVWLTPPWTDLSWMRLGPASCSPPGGGPCYS